MIDTNEALIKKVRTRVRELTGEEPIEFDITSYTPGDNPDATEEQRLEAIAQSLVCVGEPLERNDRFQFFHPDGGRPELDDCVEGVVDTRPLLRIINEA